MALASNCFDYGQDAPKNNLQKLQSLSLDDKILYSQVKIREFYIATKGKVYVAYSGGKDSTVLLHLVRSVYPDVPAVFVDTGLEFPEIRNHVKQTENVVWLKPEMSFRQVIQTKGYPVVSKSISHWVDLAQRGQPSGIKQMSMDSRFGGKRYEYLIDAPFKISRDCCDILKKNPSKKYYKETGLCPYIGMLAEESDVRRQAYVMHGENNTDRPIPTSNPLMIWTTKDIWDYIKRFELPYASIYDKGYPRTGCVFCMYGITVDRDRFVRLKATHPDLWAYCMRPIEGGGSRYKGGPGIHWDSYGVRSDQSYPIHGGIRVSRRYYASLTISLVLATVTISLAMIPIWQAVGPMGGDYSDTVDVEYPGMTIEVASSEYPQPRCGIKGSIYAFLTPDDPAVTKLADTLCDSKDIREDTIKVSTWIHKNIRYTADQGIVDHWQPASETIRIGTGDCEDMAILGASIMASSGARVALIAEEGHCLFGVECEPRAYDHAISHNGHIYVPVDSTMSNGVGCSVKPLAVIDSKFQADAIAFAAVLVVAFTAMIIVMVKILKEERRCPERC